MYAISAAKELEWGSFGKKIKRNFPSLVPAPATTPRYFSDEKMGSGPWNNFLVKTNYWVGADLLVSEKATRTSTSSYLFPEKFYESCRAELSQLLHHVPGSTIGVLSAKRGSGRVDVVTPQVSIAETTAWLTHTAWLCYSMMLASNIYPQLWSTGLHFAQNSQYVPPQYGWELDFDWISKPRSHIYGLANPTIVDSPAFDFISGADVGMSDSGAIFWFSTLLQKMPWASIKGQSSASKADLSAAAKVDKDDVIGLELLVFRAGFLGGLDQIWNNIAFVSKEIRAELVAYWERLAHLLVTLPYWDLVRGGVAAWKWYCLESLALNKLCVSRKDMMTLYYAHEDQRSLIFKAQVIGLVAKLGKLFYKAISGDLYGAGKVYYEGYQWEKAQDKIADSAIPPYEGAFVMPPMFIRGFEKGPTFDVMMKATAKDCSVSPCETIHGTTATVLQLEESVHSVEKLLGADTRIWNPPRTAPPFRAPNEVSWRTPTPAAARMPLAVPMFAASALTGGVAYLLWRVIK